MLVIFALPKRRCETRQTARLLGIVIKVSLNVHVGVVADNFNGVLVCADSSVRTESPEFAAGDFVGGCVGVSVISERKVRNIIVNADGEMLLVFVLVNGDYLRGVVSFEPSP